MHEPSADKIIGHQVNCAVCGVFIEFVPVGQQLSKSCIYGCTMTVRRPQLQRKLYEIKE